MNPTQKNKFTQGAIAVAVSLLFQPQQMLANPTGAQVVSGTVNITQPNASTLNVTNSAGAIINWQGFSIGANEVTRFIQPSASSAVLNRVVGPDISSIQGQLLSNGRVFLINPAGIIIGPNAMIDTAGFVGSALNMSNADFLAGKLRFSGDATSGAVINQGWIRTDYGGNVLLVAPRVENSGLIQTPGGELILAAGQKLTVTSPHAEGVQFEVQAPTDSVVNIGKLLADGGAVGVFAGTLRHSGDIRAASLAADASGRIVLRAQGNIELAAGSVTSVAGNGGGTITIEGNGLLQAAGTIDARGSSSAGGNVNLKADVLMQTGAVRADGASGGAITMQARNLLTAGPISTEGNQGAGGSITLQASNNLIQTAASQLSANSAAGNGGGITIQAEGQVLSSTTASATGATGGAIKVLRCVIRGRVTYVDAASACADGSEGKVTVPPR